ncbi:hypothetical protein DL764_002365 [Monosporascus ibericus]|uniref:Cytochrome P450 n=1 Tax=Monosporascus ibericus TaxID=155417 RepID=A0A4Q4TKR1_9PEZI|nr:hypothetical protein DL764_002365 [Monosporascus ibericus]
MSSTEFSIYWLGSRSPIITTPNITSVCIVLLLVIAFQGTSFHNQVYNAFRDWFRKWEYIWRGPSIIQEGFDKASGQPYEVQTPDTRYVFVSSPKHIEEIDQAPDSILSLQAASKHMLQPKYTMHGFSWYDLRGTEGVGFERALRTLLTNHLPEMLPDLSRVVKVHFEQLRSEGSNQKSIPHSRVYHMMKRLVVIANAFSFFGKELCNNQEFLDAALAYIEETVYTAEILRLLPAPLVPIVGRITAACFQSDKKVFDMLLPVVEQRCEERDMNVLGHKTPKHSDCIQWIMETSPRQNPWSAERIIWELMAIWFGSVHSLSVTSTYAIHDISRRPEYVQHLGDEIESQYAKFELTGQGLPLLDSFLKESARLTPVESTSYAAFLFMLLMDQVSTRRAAMKPFELSDGTKIGVGDWTCTPVYAINQSPEHYPDPSMFNGFRFVSNELLDQMAIDTDTGSLQPTPSALAEVSSKWQFWGTGRMACPGRFYASAVLKVIVAQVISNYDCSLVEPDVKPWLTWRSTFLPRNGFKVTFAPRQ